MPALNWKAFESLPGSQSHNFESLCRGLMRLHYGRYGEFKALANQPGVEFHIKLRSSCTIGTPPQWFGWQCKFHTRTQKGDLTASSKRDIEESLRTTEGELPGITDWILWTPYTLSKKDQDWFYSLSTSMTLHLWSQEDLDDHLSGDGILLRSTYFGELIITANDLKQRHWEAIQPIRERWLESVHQSVDAERAIRRMLGEPGSWGQLLAAGECLQKAAKTIKDFLTTSPQIEKIVTPFVAACSAFADTLLPFHHTLAEGDIDIIQHRLRERKTIVNTEVSITPRRLRALNLPIALDATNALDDMRIAQELLDEVEDFLDVGLVAVLADAGGGKTQMAAQITAPQHNRPAGILLHGRDLHRGQTLNDLARHFLINGTPVASFERLLASVDAAGKRSKCRLPIVIDGLNEAENPKDWKAELAILIEMIRKYPNVLVACTLRTGEHQRDDQQWRNQNQANARESFAVMALPSNVRKIESEGFGGDVHEAIEKYFRQYKINAGDAEIPVEFMQHPLNLRIFCEVMNPKRDSEVRVEYFPASLSPLFERYVSNVCERISQMTNLSHPYTFSEVEIAIYKLGLELWNVKKREVQEAHYRDVLSDSGRPWDCSIVNLLAQEGILFRNPGAEPGEFVITPVYDALGGYMVANSLLARHREDFTFEWLKEPAAIASFIGEESHQLAFDIFAALVTLAPRRMDGRQLWKDAPDQFRDVALTLTMGLDGKYLDKETVGALSGLLRDSLKARIRMFPRLQELRAAVDHPLNSFFLDSVLRELSVAERDLSWTEWLRESRTERFNDLVAMEARWKTDVVKRTQSDRQRVKWITWFMTSTDHELRDVATRALYWFGRGDPEALFNESLSALSVNDPYVPERILAAAYGVAMARHVDHRDSVFLDVTLPGYARRLYESVLAEGAPFGTTHLLLREYATRTIGLAGFHDPSLFTPDEIKRSRPPFVDGGLRDWGESETKKKEIHGLNSPFRMDFENYTIGGLVPGRSNYDYKNEGYLKIRSQILWRISQLGWSNDVFNTVDSLIEKQRYWPRTGSDAYKTDRYGKKYSWIAYFEMSGLLHDQGVLESWRGRPSSVDIDPSFPERVAKGHLIEADFLGDPEIEMKEWIVNGAVPDMTPYLQVAEVQKEVGPWIALDGFVNQQDEKRGRKMFCFIRSFLVPKRDVERFLYYLSRQDLGGRWLPEKPEVNYTFAGEIPWCDTFPVNGVTEFSFVTNEERVKKQQTQEELYLDGKKLEITQRDLVLRRFLGNAYGDAKEQNKITEEDLERVEVREVPVEVEEVERTYLNFSAYIPVCTFGSVGYHSAAINAGSATVLAREIADDLDLVGKPQTFELFTKDDVKATLSVSEESDEDYGNGQSMFFIREDLLKSYLDKNELDLVWAIWGEREYSNEQVEKLFHGPNRPEQPYAVFSFVKRFE